MHFLTCCWTKIPSLINTTHGWIAAGKFDGISPTRASTCKAATRLSTDELNKALQKFWEVEKYVQSSLEYAEEESTYEQHFVQSTSFAHDGRVQIDLPFKHSCHLLGDSCQETRRRFLALVH